MKLAPCLLPLALLAAPAAAQDGEEARFALVVGNAGYDIDPLRNPVNDARSMTAVLLETGFETTLVENATTAELDAAVDAFLDDLPEGAVGLFYYSGHAFQFEGRNYLLPVDIQPGPLSEVTRASLDASRLVDRFHDRGIDFGIFILDACRDNPVAPESEIGRGLAAMESDAGETLIAFSTQAGEVAFDGGGPNSPYTGALVTELDKPGEDILDVFRQVRRSVRIWTDGRQRPFISASIEREFSFRPSSGAAPVTLDLGEMSLDEVRPAVERIWWDEIEDSRVPGDFATFLARFPDSANAEVARSAAASLEAGGAPVRGLDLVQFVPGEEAEGLGEPGALASAMTTCDLVAADPDDPRRLAEGVRWGLVNLRLALRECSAALADDPINPRLLFQMGRLLDIQGRTDEAEGFYKVAGSLDYSAALVNLGYLYSAARGRERDYAEAMRLYRRAADLGNLRARTNVGTFFEKGYGVDRDVDEAAAWYRLAAQSGWPNALDALANLYREGPGDDGAGLERDLDEAVRLYRVASELGNTNAMNNLGQLYLRGDLGEPDVAAAIDWLTRASEAGNPYAPFNLGRLYRDGEAVKRDDPLAVELFERAMDQGSVPARIALAGMYQQGRGVAEDSDEAAFHLAVAALLGDPRKPDEVDAAEAALAGLGMSAERLDTARARADEWVRGNG